MIKSFAIGASLLTLAVAVPANAAFVLETNGGTGSVSTNPAGFTLTGSDGGTGNNIVTTYTRVINAARTVTFNFVFTTLDDDGSSFDPSGYLVNGVLTQLSTNGLTFGNSNSGSASVSINAGDSFGFYVNSADDAFGPGQLAISQLGIPEPATWAFMILGFGFIGGAMRYAKRTTKVAFA